jgi:hypothetical protein
MGRTIQLTILAILLILLCSFPGSAQEAEHSEHDTPPAEEAQEEAEHEEHGEAEGHGGRPHHLNDLPFSSVEPMSMVTPPSSPGGSTTNVESPNAGP